MDEEEPYDDDVLLLDLGKAQEVNVIAWRRGRT
jgi:hypothetical protein